MAQVNHWTDGGVASAELDSSSLGDKVKYQLLRDAARMYEANARQGTHSTKTRAETAYTENKPYKQKGTGNARRGDRNSPLLRGGGVIHGPRPRSYRYALPRKALREALRTALVGKLRDGEVKSMVSAPFSTPSTKRAVSVLAALECEGSTALVVPSDNETLWRSFRNIPRTHVVRAGDLNAYDVLWHRQLVFVDDAWQVLIDRLSDAKTPAAAGAES